MSLNNPLSDDLSEPTSRITLAAGLNPHYTFETFIVGTSNRMAHAASQGVAGNQPGNTYNPLFLHGAVGLGKTHLLHAIGHFALDQGRSVTYLSSETFTNQIVNAIRSRSTEQFRASYRSVDVLLVDDIQFIAGKAATEEEFFHTFNDLHEHSRQIVICSDRPPKTIPNLEERLRSRFEWGLVTEIQPPDMELRSAILRAKVDRMGRVVPIEVIDHVARLVTTNIRELEGSMNRVLAYAELQQVPLTIGLVNRVLEELTSRHVGAQVSLSQITRAVCEYYGIPEDDLRGKGRERYVVVPRQIAMYLMCQGTDSSLDEIGKELGGRNHSTIMHGRDKIAAEIDNIPTLKHEIEAIRQMLAR